MLSRPSILLNLISGFLDGDIIYFVCRDRIRFAAYQTMQAFILQAITWLGARLVGSILIALGDALWLLIVPLIIVTIGFLIILIIPASLIYEFSSAVQVNNG